STQECRVSRCLASAHKPGRVDLRRIQTLQKIVQNMDDTDKESVSNRCGHCGAFLFAQTQSPLPSQNNILSRLRDWLQNKNRWPLLGSSWSRSRTSPCSPLKPFLISVAPTAR